MKAKIPLRKFLILALLVVFDIPSRAQWLTQSFSLKSGWNAVYLHVDARHGTLDNLIGSDPNNPIQEIWLWAPPPDSVQFITDPRTPIQGNDWLSWVRSSSPSATLRSLPGNAACLIRVSRDYSWNWKGKPVAPRSEWTGSGMNLIGFSTVAGPMPAAPSFDTFFSPTPDFRLIAEIFRYNGGGITENPVNVLDLAATKVRRGEAFWIRSRTFNRYFGPFETLLGSASGIDFDDTIGQKSFRLRNRTKANLTINLMMVPSEGPPVGATGEPAIVATPPILVRGALNPTNLTYGFSELSSPVTISLKPEGQPGSDAEVILGLNRSAMDFGTGDMLAGTLRLTDSLNQLRVDLPVTAKVSSTAGLWIGNAAVTKVNQYLTTYYNAETDPAMTTLLITLGLLPAPEGVAYARDAASKRIIKYTDGDGAYLVKSVNTDLADVVRAYPLRLIIHNKPDGVATLLQRVFVGLNTAGEPIVATRETSLDRNELASARRISAAHLPFTTQNTGWTFSGPLDATANIITVPVAVNYGDQASNPFLHTYHPDHDNLDAQFAGSLPPGDESYGISRLFRLVVNPPENDFQSLTVAGTQFTGQYTETINLSGRGGFTRRFDVTGAFMLNRITSTATLRND